MLLNRDRLPNRVFGQAWPGMAPSGSTVIAQRRALAEAKYGPGGSAQAAGT